MSRRKYKPFDPAEAARIAWEARRNPALWGVNEEARALQQNEAVQSEEETRTKTRRVFRFDCYETLKLPAQTLIAVRRLEADIAMRFRVDGRDAMAEPVDGGGSADLVTSRSMDAARRIFAVTGLMNPHDAALILELSTPAVVEGSQVNWKSVVKRLRSLIDRDAASRAVKVAAEALREAYVSLDQGVRKAA